MNAQSNFTKEDLENLQKPLHLLSHPTLMDLFRKSGEVSFMVFLGEYFKEDSE